MDNNFNNGQPNMNTQYGQSDVNQQYTQQNVNTQYGQPNMNQQYTQQNVNTQYGQPNMNTQYGQAGMNQQYYGQQGYAQQPKPSVNVGESIKNVQNQFKGKVSRMGLSVFCLLGIIAAMLLIVAPFMNFASIHVNEKIEEEGYLGDIKIKIKASDGLNLFELSKLSGTVSRVADEFGGDTSDLADMLDDYEDDAMDEIEDELDMDVHKSSFRETFGTAKLLLKGRAATLVTPWILIICGLGLLVFTVINNKTMKLVFSIVPLVCLIWLMICSGHFFSIMGIGAWAIIVGIVLGVVSAIKDQPAYQ